MTEPNISPGGLPTARVDDDADKFRRRASLDKLQADKRATIHAARLEKETQKVRKQSLKKELPLSQRPGFKWRDEKTLEARMHAPVPVAKTLSDFQKKGTVQIDASHRSDDVVDARREGRVQEFMQSTDMEQKLVDAGHNFGHNRKSSRVKPRSASEVAPMTEADESEIVTDAGHAFGHDRKSSRVEPYSAPEVNRVAEAQETEMVANAGHIFGHNRESSKSTIVLSPASTLITEVEQEKVVVERRKAFDATNPSRQTTHSNAVSGKTPTSQLRARIVIGDAEADTTGRASAIASTSTTAQGTPAPSRGSRDLSQESANVKLEERAPSPKSAHASSKEFRRKTTQRSRPRPRPRVNNPPDWRPHPRGGGPKRPPKRVTPMVLQHENAMRLALEVVVHGSASWASESDEEDEEEDNDLKAISVLHEDFDFGYDTDGNGDTASGQGAAKFDDSYDSDGVSDVDGTAEQMGQEEAQSLRELARVLTRTRLNNVHNRSLEAAVLLRDALELYMEYEHTQKQHDEELWAEEEQRRKDATLDQGGRHGGGSTSTKSEMWWGFTKEVASTANSLALLLHTQPNLKSALQNLGESMPIKSASGSRSGEWKPLELIDIAIKRLEMPREYQTVPRELQFLRCTKAWMLSRPSNNDEVDTSADQGARRQANELWRQAWASDKSLGDGLRAHYRDELGMHEFLARSSVQLALKWRQTNGAPLEK